MSFCIRTRMTKGQKVVSSVSMQKLAEVCVARPVFAVMLILAMVVVGAVRTGGSVSTDFPMSTCRSSACARRCSVASPEEIESTVTKRIEDAVATVEGIDDIRSTSTESLSIVTITFGLNRNIDVAAQDVRDAVAGHRADASRCQAAADQEAGCGCLADSDTGDLGYRTPRELYEIAERGVKDSIESVGGVGQVVINGGQKRAVNVWVDADRLAAYKIPILTVRDAVARQNSADSRRARR